MSAKARRAAWCAVVFLSALACAFLLFLPQWLDKPLLFAGAERYTFYSQSVSSQAKITSASPEEAALVRLTLQNYTGESARYADAADAFLQAEKYGAELVLEQKSADVHDYYYYTPQLAGGVVLGGVCVNLHVAVRGQGASVGYPLIFGGY